MFPTIIILKILMIHHLWLKVQCYMLADAHKLGLEDNFSRWRRWGCFFYSNGCKRQSHQRFL